MEPALMATLEQELTCRELVELVTDYLEGALAPVEAQRFEAHIDHCDGCRAYLDQLRWTIALTGKITEDSLSEPARKELLEVFRGWRRSG